MYRIQCAGTGTFLEMDDEYVLPLGLQPTLLHLTIERAPFRSAEDWRIVSCSGAIQDRDLQLWSFERVSRTTLEIKGVMSSWKPDLINHLFHPYGDNDE